MRRRDRAKSIVDLTAPPAAGLPHPELVAAIPRLRRYARVLTGDAFARRRSRAGHACARVGKAAAVAGGNAIFAHGCSPSCTTSTSISWRSCGARRRTSRSTPIPAAARRGSSRCARTSSSASSCKEIVAPDRPASGRSARGAAARCGRGAALRGDRHRAVDPDRHRDVATFARTRQAAAPDCRARIGAPRRQMNDAAMNPASPQRHPRRRRPRVRRRPARAGPRAASSRPRSQRDPELAARVAEIRAQIAALRDALDPMLAEPIPDRAARRGVGAAQRVRDGRLRRWLVAAFAAAATLVLGVAIGWFGRDVADRARGHADDVSRGRRRSRTRSTPPTPTAPSRSGRTRKRASSRGSPSGSGSRCTRRISNGVGYALVGGRLVAGNEKPDGALHVRERRQAAAVAAGAQAIRRQASTGTARRRSVTRSKTASASSTGSTTMLRLRDLRQRRSRAAPQDRAGRLRAARRGRGARRSSGDSTDAASRVACCVIRRSPSLARDAPLARPLARRPSR